MNEPETRSGVREFIPPPQGHADYAFFQELQAKLLSQPKKPVLSFRLGKNSWQTIKFYWEAHLFLRIIARFSPKKVRKKIIANWWERKGKHS